MELDEVDEAYAEGITAWVGHFRRLAIANYADHYSVNDCGDVVEFIDRHGETVDEVSIDRILGRVVTL